VVTLSEETLASLSSRIADEIVLRRARTSDAPTPAHPLPELDGLEVEGKAVDPVDLTKPRKDAKRYLNAFKKAVHGFNRFHKVSASLTVITITEEIGGVVGAPRIFQYNVCVIKSLYLQLRAHDNNVARMLNFLDANPTAINQFPTGDYKSVATPE
jgi:hypothetical protein